MEKIFFNSSMPRSGSTLLQNILGNNPDFYATPTSGLLEMIQASKKVYTQNPTFKAQDAEVVKNGFFGYCNFAIHGYFSYITDKKYVIDKSRGWAINVPFLDCFYPNAKVICIVRDLREVLASMEKNYLKYPEKFDVGFEEKETAITVEQRVTLWMKGNPVGTTFKRLQEVIRRGICRKIHFVKYEDLCENPKLEMQKIHEYLEVPYYEYDFKNIVQVTSEDDKWHGKYGDHIIRNEIIPTQKKAIKLLGQPLCNQIYEKNKWYFDFFNYNK
jgi:sulfotransferase